MDHAQHEMKPTMTSHYRSLPLMLLLSFVAMYILMYAMVNRFANVYSNVNQLYMAGLMTSPMALIELAVMRAMYKDRKLNALIGVLSLLVGLGCWFGIRRQGGVTDAQFLKSMIPHHGGAILMCQQASLKDPDLQKLCSGIIASQQSEIDLMKAKLGN